MGKSLSKEGLGISLAAETDQASRQMFQISQHTKQKIAAFGSSYMRMRSPVDTLFTVKLFGCVYR
ncbi:hypothetical protein EGJ55_23585 [Pseudomonas moraviensis]|nr:hypothetical protein EGJ55_23585 [Pseudomonas moraviensis]